MKLPSRFSKLQGTTFALLLIFGAGQFSATDANASGAFGLNARLKSKAYLSMPPDAGGTFPSRLSQTGAFLDTSTLAPAAALVPYDLIVPFWSDGAAKSRWVSIPDNQKIKFAPTGEWVFPRGTVFVKTFSLATNDANPNSLRRLETRLLVCDADGGVYGVTYKWRADGSDADLLATNLTEAVLIQTATGVRTQQWYYPSRADCPRSLPHRQCRLRARCEDAAVEPRFHLSFRRHGQ